MTMHPEDRPPAGIQSGGSKRKARNVVPVGASVAVIAIMVALTYASVPLYRLFCQVTGLAGTTQVATAAPGAVTGADVEVRFDANVASNLPWRFTPPGPVKVHLGEERQVAFTAANLGAEPTLGTATYNVAPLEVGKYFDKIQCFCFTEQLLMPGERKEFTVSFFVDPAFAQDEDTKSIPAITLSYTFYNKGRGALEEYLQSHPVAAHSGLQVK
jgi:cytochrome c oxidase assembly protein subunit 11